MSRFQILRLAFCIIVLLGLFSPLSAADPRTGKALYVGAAPFSRGGAPCLACHGHAATGLGMSSGYYGPDLTSLYDNYGEMGVRSVLEFLSFPSMDAYYRERPLTEQEIADLTAFFGQTVAAGSLRADRLPLWVVIALVIAAAAAVLVAKRRMQPGVRQSLINQQRQTISKGGKS